MLCFFGLVKNRVLVWSSHRQLKHRLVFRSRISEAYLSLSLSLSISLNTRYRRWSTLTSRCCIHRASLAICWSCYSVMSARRPPHQAAKYFNGNNSVTSVRFLLKRTLRRRWTEGLAHACLRARSACVSRHALFGASHARTRHARRVAVAVSLWHLARAFRPFF